MLHCSHLFVVGFAHKQFSCNAIFCKKLSTFLYRCGVRLLFVAGMSNLANRVCSLKKSISMAKRGPLCNCGFWDTTGCMLCCFLHMFCAKFVHVLVHVPLDMRFHCEFHTLNFNEWLWFIRFFVLPFKHRYVYLYSSYSIFSLELIIRRITVLPLSQIRSLRVRRKYTRRSLFVYILECIKIRLLQDLSFS